jgi:hypothetical protein
MLKRINVGTIGVTAVQLADSSRLHDRLEVPTERKFKPETGQMIAPATIARTGIMNYRAGDCLGIDKTTGEVVSLFPEKAPDEMVKVMTTEAALFDEATLESARSAPITIGHPRDEAGNLIDVSASNANDLQKGSLEGLPTRLGDDLLATVVIGDADTIAIVQEQADELSIGQTCDLILADEAVEWDAEKANIRINHVAIVRKGRAQSAKIRDEAIKVSDLDVDTPTVEEIATKHGVKLADIEAALEKGIAVEMEHTTKPAIAAIIARDHLAESAEYYVHLVDEVTLQDSLDNLQAQSDVNSELVKELKIKLADAETALLTATDIALSDAVENRIELITKARLLDSEIETKGKTEVEIQRACLEKTYSGSVVLADQSDAYVAVVFNMALDNHQEDHGVSELQTLLNDEANKTIVKPHKPTLSPQEQARQRSIKRNAE